MNSDMISERLMSGHSPYDVATTSDEGNNVTIVQGLLLASEVNTSRLIATAFILQDAAESAASRVATERLINEVNDEMAWINTTTTTTTSYFLTPEQSDSGRPPPPTLTSGELARSLLLFGMMILSLIANLAALVSTYRRRHRQICINLLILHLCFADLLVTIFGLGANAVWILTVSWRGGNALCKFVKFCEAWGLYASAFIVAVISIDRCLAVIDPVALGAANTRVKIMVFVAWSLATLFSIPQILVFSVVEAPFNAAFEQCVTFENLAQRFEWWYLLFTISTQFVAPLIVIIASYSLILRTVCQKLREFGRSQEVMTQANDRASTCCTTDTLFTANVNININMHANTNTSAQFGKRHGIVTVGLRCNSATGTSATSARTMLGNSGGTLRPPAGVVFRRARNKSMKIATAIVCTFILSWTPYFVSYAYLVLSNAEDAQDTWRNEASDNSSVEGFPSIVDAEAQDEMFVDLRDWQELNWYLVLELFHRGCCLINPLIYGALNLKLRSCAYSKSRRRRRSENGFEANAHNCFCLPIIKCFEAIQCLRSAINRRQMPVETHERLAINGAAARATLHRCRCVCPACIGRPNEMRLEACDCDFGCSLMSERSRARRRFRFLPPLPFFRSSHNPRKAKLVTVTVTDKRTRVGGTGKFALRRQYECARNYCRILQLLNPRRECAHFQLKLRPDHEQHINRLEVINTGHYKGDFEMPNVQPPITI